MFDKAYVVIFVVFSRWLELYAVIGWAFSASCGGKGADYCALKRSGPMYSEECNMPTTKKRKRDKNLASTAPPPLNLPSIEVRRT